MQGIIIVLAFQTDAIAVISRLLLNYNLILASYTHHNCLVYRVFLMNGKYSNQQSRNYFCLLFDFPLFLKFWHMETLCYTRVTIINSIQHDLCRIVLYNLKSLQIKIQRDFNIVYVVNTLFTCQNFIEVFKSRL